MARKKRGERKRRKRKGRSVQELIGITSFTDYGLATTRGELLFFLVAPTNISVLSRANIEIKIHELMVLLSTYPDIEVTCTDSSECFDDNKLYLKTRMQEETNPQVRSLLEQDMTFLDKKQVEMATARQFLFTIRLKNRKEKLVFETANEIERKISEQGFEVHRMQRPEIKRFLALYFGASMYGEQMPDADGAQYLEGAYAEKK